VLCVSARSGIYVGTGLKKENCEPLMKRRVSARSSEQFAGRRSRPGAPRAEIVGGRIELSYAADEISSNLFVSQSSRPSSPFRVCLLSWRGSESQQNAYVFGYSPERCQVAHTYESEQRVAGCLASAVLIGEQIE
jgi:hypothetical protein